MTGEARGAVVGIPRPHAPRLVGGGSSRALSRGSRAGGFPRSARSARTARSGFQVLADLGDASRPIICPTWVTTRRARWSSSGVLGLGADSAGPPAQPAPSADQQQEVRQHQFLRSASSEAVGGERGLLAGQPLGGELAAPSAGRRQAPSPAAAKYADAVACRARSAAQLPTPRPRSGCRRRGRLTDWAPRIRSPVRLAVRMRAPASMGVVNGAATPRSWKFAGFCDWISVGSVVVPSGMLRRDYEQLLISLPVRRLRREIVERGPSGQMPPVMPEQTRGERAGRPPASASWRSAFGSGRAASPFSSAAAPPPTRFSGGEHVQPLQREQQVNLRRPGAETFDRRDGGDRRVVLHRRQSRRAERACRNASASTRACATFRARQSGGAQVVRRTGRADPPVPARRAAPQAAPDRGGGLVADHLRDDPVEQAGKPGARVRQGSGPARSRIPARSGSRGSTRRARPGPRRGDAGRTRGDGRGDWAVEWRVGALQRREEKQKFRAWLSVLYRNSLPDANTPALVAHAFADNVVFK